MATEQEYQALYDRIGALREQLTARLAPDLLVNPQLADALVREVNAMLASVVAEDQKQPVPADAGLAQLVGLGRDAAQHFGETRVPSGVAAYDESVTSERVIAVADLYYLYQHEKLGVFRAIRKLQQLFEAGTVRLSGGAGAYGLYRFDRRGVLRYTHRDRQAAYRRALGYGHGPLAAGARPNLEFHPLFSHFNNQVGMYWRDKRVSDVIRERSFDPSFGSIATVRRAGLDLRNNLKFTSYGHINVLRVEVMQLLDEAFRILGAEDVRRLFGADNAWDVVEEILTRYLGERPATSPRQRMAVSGREILRWLAQPHVLQTSRSQFEALLLEIAEYAEEWLTSAEVIGAAARPGARRLMPWDRPSPARVAAVNGSRAG